MKFINRDRHSLTYIPQAAALDAACYVILHILVISEVSVINSFTGE
jgi:hypothetical protein